MTLKLAAGNPIATAQLSPLLQKSLSFIIRILADAFGIASLMLAQA
jgi:hypothetical protein